MNCPNLCGQYNKGSYGSWNYEKSRRFHHGNLSFSACGTNYKIDNNSELPVENSQSEIDTSKYFIQTPYYQIYGEDLQEHKYRITSGKDILVEDTKSGTAPQIEDKGEGVLKLHLGFEPKFNIRVSPPKPQGR